MKNKLTINNIEYTKDPIKVEDFEKNDIFIFGSNTLGEHGGGAARFAHDKLGAKWGIGEGMASEQTYAFPTLVWGKTKTDEIGIPTGKVSELDFFKSFLLLKYTIENELPHNKIIYITKLGLGIAGWDLEVVKDLFWKSGLGYMDNVVYPIEFEINECL